MHAVPAGHVKGGTQDVCSKLTAFGGRHAWHTPNVENLPVGHLVQLLRDGDGPLPAAQGRHVTWSLETTLGAAQ